MSEHYVLCDMENRDSDGSPWEIIAPTLARFVPYVDGPVRNDTLGAEGRQIVDDAIAALRRENFPVADKNLRELGIYLRLEHRKGGGE